VWREFSNSNCEQPYVDLSLHFADRKVGPTRGTPGDTVDLPFVPRGTCTETAQKKGLESC